MYVYLNNAHLKNVSDKHYSALGKFVVVFVRMFFKTN